MRLSHFAGVVTQQDGTVCERRDYYPFGERIDTSSGDARSEVTGYALTCGFEQRFTGKERDVESGLDYFLARYYASGIGRFTGADAPFADQSAAEPQSWNLYGYVRNNPLALFDPDGRATKIATHRIDKALAVTQRDLLRSVTVAAEFGRGVKYSFRGGKALNATVGSSVTVEVKDRLVNNQSMLPFSDPDSMAAKVLLGAEGSGIDSPTVQFKLAGEVSRDLKTGETDVSPLAPKVGVSSPSGTGADTKGSISLFGATGSRNGVVLGGSVELDTAAVYNVLDAISEAVKEAAANAAKIANETLHCIGGSTNCGVIGQ